MKSDFVILNGFDRSGSSAISKTLANHPDIELIMQPFNSGFMRKGMYRAIEKGEYLQEAEMFFSELVENKLPNEQIVSHWHKKHSTTQKYVPGNLHLVKTTINHFAQRYMNQAFPEIDVWGIWRDPFDIIHSIKKNDFQNAWYSEALEELEPTVTEELVLRKPFLNFFSEDLSEDQELALLFAIRSYFFFYYLDAGKLIRYDRFKKNANEAFQKFTNDYGLKNFDFSKESAQDLNIIGAKYNPKNQSKLDLETRKKIQPIIQPLIDLFNSKF